MKLLFVLALLLCATSVRASFFSKIFYAFTSIELTYDPSLTDEQLARIDADCEYTREDAIDCARDVVDTDGNGKITIAEIDDFRNRNTGAILNFLLNNIPGIASYVRGETDEKIMDHCDTNRDGVVDVQEIRHNEHTCMRHCKDRKLFMYFCSNSQ